MQENSIPNPVKPLSPIKANLIANLAGNSFVAFLLVLFVPFYMRYMGAESYGLVGFFVPIQAIATVLDFGLSTTINRELAIRDGVAGKEKESRDIVRTLEIVSWVGTIAIGGLAIITLPLLSGWLNPQHLSTETIKTCAMIVGATLALQFPVSFYSGGILGLQRHVVLNVTNAVFGILKSVGALSVLHYVSSSPEAFFTWQLLVTTAQALVLAVLTWGLLPKADGRTNFRKDFFSDIWKFTTGVSGIVVMWILVTQADKFVLGKMLPLETFGYYALAAQVANGLGRLVTPVFQTFFPRLSQLKRSEDQKALARTYHQGTQMMSLLVFPVAAMFVLFSPEILFLWQRNPETTRNAYLLISLLVAGAALNSVQFIPYALQLAYGWTKLYFYSLTVAVLILVVGTIFAANKFGATGAASVGIFLNASFILIVIPIMHRRLLPNEKWKWLINDLLKPMLGVSLAAVFARFLFFATDSVLLIFAQLGVIFAFIFASACLCTAYAREKIFGFIYRHKTAND